MTVTGYCPKLIVGSQSTTIVGTSETTKIIINGEFLDQVENILVTSIGSGVGVISNIINIGHTTLEFDFTVDATTDTYTLTLEGVCGDFILNPIQALPVVIIIPDTIGSAPELWVQTGGSNTAIVTAGGFEAQDSTGNGWNEHAYFGAVTSTSQVDFEMTIDRLNGVSSAFGYVRFNSTNTPSTTGNPRIYIQGGNSLTAYNSLGSQTSIGSILDGDTIKVTFTPTTMQVFKNNVSIYIDTGVYNLTNMFVTFTSFRVLKVIDIKLSVY